MQKAKNMPNFFVNPGQFGLDGNLGSTIIWVSGLVLSSSCPTILCIGRQDKRPGPQQVLSS
jgi:hypothetical protein